MTVSTQVGQILHDEKLEILSNCNRWQKNHRMGRGELKWSMTDIYAATLNGMNIDVVHGAPYGFVKKPYQRARVHSYGSRKHQQASTPESAVG